MSGSWIKRFAPALLGMVCASPAFAFEFTAGGVHGNLDTTISGGTTMRVSGRDCRLVGTTNGGCSTTSTNADDGNLNFDKYDFTSAPLIMSHELALDWQNYGAFFRVTSLYDPLLDKDGATARTDLSDSAKGNVGRSVDLLDAYTYGNFNVLDRNLSIRAGQQAINWGESLFTAGGINQTNPVDVSKLRQPGSEIKLATIPTPIIDLSADIWGGLSLEGYYQFTWRMTKVEPVGTYFSTGDLTGSGAQGLFSTAGDPGKLGTAAFTTPGNYVPKTANREPTNAGQWGSALRYFVDDWGTEFAGYYMRYHSKTPILGVTAQRLPAPPFARPVGYFEEFPARIDLFGASFSSSLFGTAIGGEVAYQPEFPVPLNLSATTAAASAGALTVPVGQTYTKSGFVYVRKWQAALTDIASFSQSDAFIGPVLSGIGANTGSLATELVGSLYPNLAKGTVVYATPASKTVPTDMQWGYRLSASVNYPQAFGTNILMTPSVSFSHDVDGTVPNNSNGATFIENRKAVTLGLTGAYLSAWKGTLAYTNYFGAGGDDLLSDRDYVSMSVSYSF